MRSIRVAQISAPNGAVEIVEPPVPPFTEESARQKVQAAEEAWNTRAPERVALACTEDTEWRNRAEFIQGRSSHSWGYGRNLQDFTGNPLLP